MGAGSTHAHPHSARMYDYFLDGKDNYEADRQAAEEILRIWPTIKTAAKVNRAFMHRSTRFLAESGIRQFLDIGTGIPTSPNLHQIAQEVAPECRVVYVDHDPLVLAHARALMASTPEGATAYLEADATDPETILRSPEITELLDSNQPIGLSMIALLHFIESGAEQIVRTFLDALAPGSYLVICAATADFDPTRIATAREIYRARGITAQDRSRDEFARFFRDLELIDPGIVPPHRWRPDGVADIPDSYDANVSCYAAVARKP